MSCGIHLVLSAAAVLPLSESGSAPSPAQASIQSIVHRALENTSAAASCETVASGVPHSAEYLNAKERAFWWDSDYLALIANRVDFSHVEKALDVGCGKGAWTEVVSSLLPKGAKITGIDSDPQWIELMQSSSSPHTFLVADAVALPFEDESFDMVTCQTLLIYALHPEKMLFEMARVLKPGGVLVLSEPNNVANLSSDSNTVQEALSFEERMDITRLYLICQEGKKLRGQGFSSIGPQLCYRLSPSITHLHSLVSNKMNILIPPYQSEEQLALLDFIYSASGEDRFKFWPKDLALDHFLAVYPRGQKEFDRLWQVALKFNAIHRQQIQERRLAGVFGGGLILTIGKKS